MPKGSARSRTMYPTHTIESDLVTLETNTGLACAPGAFGGHAFGLDLVIRRLTHADEGVAALPVSQVFAPAANRWRHAPVAVFGSEMKVISFEFVVPIRL